MITFKVIIHCEHEGCKEIAESESSFSTDSGLVNCPIIPDKWHTLNSLGVLFFCPKHNPRDGI